MTQMTTVMTGHINGQSDCNHFDDRNDPTYICNDPYDNCNDPGACNDPIDDCNDPSDNCSDPNDNCNDRSSLISGHYRPK